MRLFVRLQADSARPLDLRDRVARLEALGVGGVLLTDHLFGTAAGAAGRAVRTPEPLTLLAAVATLSDQLHVGTIVSNVGLLHPALVLRGFAQLAMLAGGERVLAGLGAGWNRPEFDALGLAMPSHADRLDRLEEAAHLARQLFDHGAATLEGRHVVVRDLPLAPLPATPPRLLLGGGSDRLLRIAGRYADVLDLNGSSRRRPVAGANLAHADRRRRLSTTVADLEASVAQVRQAAAEAGRPPDAPGFSLLLDRVEVCTAAEAAARTAALAEAVSLDPREAADSPYLLLGEPAHLAERVQALRARLGLRQLVVPEADVETFSRHVLPRLSGG